MQGRGETVGIDQTAIAKWLAQTPGAEIGLALFGVVGTIATIASFIYAILVNRVRKPSYCVRSNNLIRNAASQYPDLEISYRQYSGTVANLTVAKVMFFNKGREAIRRGDMVKADPIRIQMRDGTIILGVNVLYSKTENQFSVARSADRTSAMINFEFLDFTDGAVIQVFHTGTDDADVTVEGLVINAGRPKRIGWTRPTANLITLTSFGVMFIASMYMVAILEGRFHDSPFEFIDVCALTAMGLWSIFRLWEIIFRKRPIPRGRYKWSSPFYQE
jgi:hypothetical protein